MDGSNEEFSIPGLREIKPKEKTPVELEELAELQEIQRTATATVIHAEDVRKMTRQQALKEALEIIKAREPFEITDEHKELGLEDELKKYIALYGINHRLVRTLMDDPEDFEDSF